jgi:ferredoxin
MTYVVTDLCTGCRYTECVTVCPVTCFHMDERMTYIDPENCIDCGGCATACPVGAIQASFLLPADKAQWIEINRVRSAETPVIAERLPPLPTAEARRAELGL